MMGVMEILWLGNGALDLAFRLAERVERGEMTKEEADAEWRKQVVDIKAEEARFERLTGGGSPPGT